MRRIFPSRSRHKPGRIIVWSIATTSVQDRIGKRYQGAMARPRERVTIGQSWYQPRRTVSTALCRQTEEGKVRADMKWIWLGLLLVSGKASGQSELQFGSIRALTNREVALVLSGGTSATFRVEVSSNLVDWPALWTLPLTAAALQQTDNAAPYLSQ